MSAIISPCGIYRYRLERDLGMFGGRTMALIMVNPSTADGEDDDATIRKAIGFATRLGVGRLIVGNKFAYRATDINALRTAPDAIGPDNDSHLDSIMRDADLHVVAWGRLTKLPESLRSRWRSVVSLADAIGCRLHALAVGQDGHPSHPLMLPYSSQIAPWSPSLPAQEDRR